MQFAPQLLQQALGTTTALGGVTTLRVVRSRVRFAITMLHITAGFSHSAFTFAHESLVARSVVADSEVPAGALVTFLQKGLQYVEVETHLQEVRCRCTKPLPQVYATAAAHATQ